MFRCCFCRLQILNARRRTQRSISLSRNRRIDLIGQLSAVKTPRIFTETTILIMAWCRWILAKIGPDQVVQIDLQSRPNCWKSPEMNVSDLVLYQDIREFIWDRVVVANESIQDHGFLTRFRSKLSIFWRFVFMVHCTSTRFGSGFKILGKFRKLFSTIKNESKEIISRI